MNYLAYSLACILCLLPSILRADDLLGATKESIRQTHRGKLALAPRFGDVTDSDVFREDPYTTFFGYKNNKVVYCIIQRFNGPQTLVQAEIDRQLDISRSGGKWTITNTSSERSNPDRTYNHQKKDGADWVNTGNYGKERHQRKSLITYSKDWTGDPEAGAASLLNLPIEEMLKTLKTKGLRGHD